MNDKWLKAQAWELDWHSDCVNSLNEELKQLVYAEKMGLVFTPTSKTPYNIDLQYKSILDIGSGPCSLLLKCTNKGLCYASDPLMAKFPAWVADRYIKSKIVPLKIAGEKLFEISEFSGEINDQVVDEVWIYNVLEHVINPQEVIKNAKKLSKIIRIFEWLDTRSNIGHPHTLKERELNGWLDGTGKVEDVKRGGAVGKAYYGVFKGDNYEKI